MKIIFVIGSLAGGGAERVVSVLSNEFYNLGHQVTIITLAKDECTYTLNKGIQRLHIDSDTKIKGLSGLQRVIRLGKCIKRNNSDVVISFTSGISIYVLLVKMMLPFKVIVSERNDPKRDPRNKLMRKIRNCLYNLSNGFVFQTPEAQNYFSDKIKSRSTVISNPIKACLPEPYKGRRANRIVATGRLETQKNYPLLIEAFAEFLVQYPEYILDIYGSGSLEDELHQKVLKLNVAHAVIFKGIVTNWHEKAKDAGMYILTSDYEGMSNALMEAIAIGLPCISSDCPCGGSRYLISNGENGLLFPVGNKEALVSCMDKIAGDSKYAQRMSNLGMLNSQRFELINIAEAWMKYIKKIKGN